MAGRVFRAVSDSAHVSTSLVTSFGAVHVLVRTLARRLETSVTFNEPLAPRTRDHPVRARMGA